MLLRQGIQFFAGVTTLARHLSAAGDVRMDCCGKSPNSVWPVPVHIQGQHSPCNYRIYFAITTSRKTQGDAGFKRGFDWRQAASTKTTPPYVRHALAHPSTDGGSVPQASWTPVNAHVQKKDAINKTTLLCLFSRDKSLSFDSMWLLIGNSCTLESYYVFASAVVGLVSTCHPKQQTARACRQLHPLKL